MTLSPIVEITVAPVRGSSNPLLRFLDQAAAELAKLAGGSAFDHVVRVSNALSDQTKALIISEGVLTSPAAQTCRAPIDKAAWLLDADIITYRREAEYLGLFANNPLRHYTLQNTTDDGPATVITGE